MFSKRRDIYDFSFCFSFNEFNLLWVFQLQKFDLTKIADDSSEGISVRF